ncbi:MAG: HAD family hydrolase [Candidatus Omnitrophota bacterium]|nr:HAD family hydrolase [Candidatus Omnitrophota bacterium]
MRKINKIITIALIFTIIGAGLCSEFARAENTALRIPFLSQYPRSGGQFRVFSLLAQLQKVNPEADPQPKAVLFDFDGTLADTSPQVENAFGKVYHWIMNGTANDSSYKDIQRGKEYLFNSPWRTVAGHIDGIIDQSKKHGHSQKALLEIMHELAERYDLQDINIAGDNLVFGFGLIYEAVLLEELTRDPPVLLPGALELLTALRKENMPIYIGTGMPQRAIEVITERLGIEGCFKAIYGVSIESPAAFPVSKTDILKKIKRDLGIEQDNQIIIFGDSAGDMEAKSAGAIAIGVTRSNPEAARRLEKDKADFLIPDFVNWKFYCEQLGFLGSYNVEINSSGQETIPFPYQFVRALAVKGAPLGSITFEKIIPAPFNSSIIQEIRETEPARPLSGYNFNRTLPGLFPVIRYALETEDVNLFKDIVSGIINSNSLNETEKREVFETIIAWSRLFPTSVKGGRYHPYSYEHFAEEVRDYKRQNPDRKNIAIGVFGSGDGIGVFQDRNMLKIFGVADFEITQFEKNEEAVRRAKLFNPQDTYVRGDLASLSDATRQQYLGKFDVIYIRNVLHEIFTIYGENGVRRILMIASEFLKPGGRLLFHDGVYPKNGGQYVRLRFKTEEAEMAFDHFAESTKWKIEVVNRMGNGTVLLRYGDAVKFASSGERAEKT